MYPSIAPIPTIESDVLYQSQHFDPQPQIHFQQQHQQHQQRQPQRQRQQHQHQHQHQPYLDPTLAEHDLRIFTQGPAHNPSYDTPIAPYPASDSSEGPIDMWGGVLNWVDGQNSSMPMHQYLHTQPHHRHLSSARFRQKKKQREMSLEMSVKEQKERIGMMECRIRELEGENGFLKELVMGRIKWKEEKDDEENDNEENDNEKGKEKDDGKTK
ncbi:hypothetical protein DID88_004645 [Monilinia fructigena]|uniref:BZIP domain-containing protein n=1 Tax=Monilinia fructigena TaxID=38457 RepID=A0A395ITS1_9HELO|nr:hypothetical protein DID88_004645 [Monilinia fructigena]